MVSRLFDRGRREPPNNGAIAPDRFHLFQCSVYEMPFPDGSFDRAFCLGVLQHTPDFSKSVRSIIRKVKIGGEIVVDFYPITGFWTKLHAKYLLRPATKRLPKTRLLRLIERTATPLGKLARGLRSAGLGTLTRFVPVADDRGFPRDLSPDEYREWLVLDNSTGTRRNSISRSGWRLFGRCSKVTGQR